jgi:hypothetical protein
MTSATPGRAKAAIWRRAQLQAQGVESLGEGGEAEDPPEAPARRPGRYAAHEHGPTGVTHTDLDVRGGDHAREVVAVRGRVVEILADLSHRAGPELVAAVDLHGVADGDVRARQGSAARSEDPLAALAHVDDVEAAPGDLVGRDDEVVHV